MSDSSVTRRDFIKQATHASLVAGSLTATTSLAQRVPDPPGKKLGWAIVGLGSLAINQILPASHAQLSSQQSQTRHNGVARGTDRTFRHTHILAQGSDIPEATRGRRTQYFQEFRTTSPTEAGQRTRSVPSPVQSLFNK